MKILPKEKVNLWLVIGYLLFHIVKVIQTYLDIAKCRLAGNVINLTALFESISYRVLLIPLECILFIVGILYIYRDTNTKHPDNIKALVLLIIGVLLMLCEMFLFK